MKGKKSRSEEIYSFLPPVDKLLGKRGLQNGHWIGLIGEPASYKSFFSKWAAKKWLEYKPFTTVIYIATEENNRNVEKSLKAIGIDVDKYKSENRLMIGSVFCYESDKEEKVNNSPNGVITFAMNGITKFAKHFKSFSGFRTLLIIDSMSSFWAHAPAMSRSIWSSIYGALFHKVDLAMVTLQLASSTHKAFGWGAEHGVDVAFRFGKYIDNAEAFRYFAIDKVRNDKEVSKIFKTDIQNGEFVIKDPVSIGGKYGSFYDAIIGMKYENDQELRREANQYYKEIAQKMNKITAFIGAITKKYAFGQNNVKL